MSFVNASSAKKCPSACLMSLRLVSYGKKVAAPAWKMKDCFAADEAEKSMKNED